LAFNRTGEYLAAGGLNSVRIWEFGPARLKRSFEAPGARVNFNTGTLLASAGQTPLQPGRSVDLSIPYIVTVWDARTGVKKATFTGDAYYAHAVAFTPDNYVSVWGGGNCVNTSNCSTVKQWRVEGGDQRTLKGPSEFPTGASFCQDPAYLIVGSHDGRITLWDVNAQKPRYTSSPIGQFLESAACNADNKKLASAETRGRVTIWSADKAAPMLRLEGLTNSIDDVFLSQDGKSMTFGNRAPNYVYGYTYSTTDWDLKSEAPPTFVGGRLPLAITPDGQWLALSQDKTTVIVRNLSGKQPETATQSSGIRGAFSKAGDLFVATHELDLEVWSYHPWKKERTLRSPHKFMIQRVAFRPDGRLFASASSDGTVAVWNTKSEDVRCIFGSATTPEHTVWTVAFSPDNKLAASAGNDAVIELWNPSDCTKHDTLLGHEGPISDIAFSPRGKVMASAGKDGTVRLWMLDGSRRVTTLSGHGWIVNSVVFNTSGDLLISGGADGTAKVWDVKTGKELASLVTFSDRKNWLVATPEGLFDSTADAADHVYWRAGQVNELAPLSTYYTDFYRPGLLVELFEGLRPRPALDIALALRIPGLRVMLSQTPRQAHLEDRNGRVLVCFHQIPSTAVQAVPGEPERPSEINGFRVDPADSTCKYQAEVPASEDNQTEYLRGLESGKVETFKTPWDGKPSATANSTLHVLSVGASQYPSESGFDPLPYAATSARAIEKFFDDQRLRADGVYAKVRVWPGLYDLDATTVAIRRTFEEMSGEVKEDDVVVLYLAGHGVVIPGLEMFYFAPIDAGLEPINNTGLNTAMLAEALRNMPARRIVLIIDACQSGGAVEALSKIGEVKARIEQGRMKVHDARVIASDEHGVGVYVIAATLPLAYAVNLGADRSALASTVMNALKGASGPISVRQMITSLNERLPETSDNAVHFRQIPLISSIGADFPLATP
jgi:WD40 repeat protein